MLKWKEQAEGYFARATVQLPGSRDPKELIKPSLLQRTPFAAKLASSLFAQGGFSEDKQYSWIFHGCELQLYLNVSSILIRSWTSPVYIIRFRFCGLLFLLSVFQHPISDVASVCLEGKMILVVSYQNSVSLIESFVSARIGEPVRTHHGITTDAITRLVALPLMKVSGNAVLCAYIYCFIVYAQLNGACMVAAGTNHGQIVLIEVNSNTARANPFPAQSSSAVTALAASQLLCAGFADGHVECWSLDGTLCAPLQYEKRAVVCMAVAELEGGRVLEMCVARGPLAQSVSASPRQGPAAGQVSLNSHFDKTSPKKALDALDNVLDKLPSQGNSSLSLLRFEKERGSKYAFRHSQDVKVGGEVKFSGVRFVSAQSLAVSEPDDEKCPRSVAFALVTLPAAPADCIHTYVHAGTRACGYIPIGRRGVAAATRRALGRRE
jgi:hypothetical protein